MSGTPVTSKPTIPASILTCQAAPKVPADTNNSKQVSNYIVDLYDAHQDCRGKLGQVRRLVNE